MRLIATILLVIVPASFAWGQNYRVGHKVIAAGGGSGQSANFRVDGTVGQPVVGTSVSANFTAQAGFWYGVIGGGCPYIPGDINGIGGANGLDVVYGVVFLKGIGGPPPDSCDCRPYVPHYPFYAAMDVNGNCQANGIDITYFVAFLKGLQPGLLHCADCPPRNIDQSPTGAPSRRVQHQYGR